jgi:cytochrome c556
MQSKTRIAVAASLLALLISGTANAGGHNKQNPEVKYRQDVMKAMSHNFSAFVAIFTNRVDRPDQLTVHADALAAMAALTATLFPEGSEGGKALPAAWEEPEKVAAAAQKIADATAALAAAAATGDKGAMKDAFRSTGEGCKGCHEAYKEEDD